MSTAQVEKIETKDLSVLEEVQLGAFTAEQVAALKHTGKKLDKCASARLGIDLHSGLDL